MHCMISAILHFFCLGHLLSLVWKPLVPPLAGLLAPKWPLKLSKRAPTTLQERPKRHPIAFHKPWKPALSRPSDQESSKRPPRGPQGPPGTPLGLTGTTSRDPPGRQKRSPGHLQETSRRSPNGPWPNIPGPAECAERLNPPPPTGEPSVLDIIQELPVAIVGNLQERW